MLVSGGMAGACMGHDNEQIRVILKFDALLMDCFCLVQPRIHFCTAGGTYRSREVIKITINQKENKEAAGEVEVFNKGKNLEVASWCLLVLHRSSENNKAWTIPEWHYRLSCASFPAKRACAETWQ